MPTLSMFYGIIIRMQSESGAQHNLPHIHALYGDHEVVVGLDGEVIEGDFPKKQMRFLQAWISLHEDELLANWNLLLAGDGYFKIDPLS
ncbi:DUF4160 domain-containing protein [Anaerovorax odorimutans]|uniref:DUF4160 domain-containing protein n=1 Tax=Anaerovorax odorimutans TaxID=109327 RepID=A0ABT1RS95_9FIRM|nr:DUF4160 domain-containing protein [Anaerovorax odorimutans]MCQ4638042.1 DUF4160 domain-containing protein [Anaerovorax odorimutans]